MKICVPIKEKSLKKCLKSIEIASKNADILEIWLDNLEKADYSCIIKGLKKPVLVVNKSKEEKGDFKGSDNERVECLIEALKYKPKYLDIGINTDIELINEIFNRKKRTELIISYHNYEMTPEWSEMQRICELMVGLGADIIKFASVVKNSRDSINLIRLIDLIKRMGKKSVITGMGKRGKIVRVIAPMLGCEWTYAPLSAKKATAPGQFTKNQLEGIWKLLDS